MLRHARALGREDLLRIAVSSRTLAELPYAEELMDAGALIVLTREAHGIRPAGRITAGELLPLWEPGQTAFVCGRDVVRRVGQPDPGRPRLPGARRCGSSGSAPAGRLSLTVTVRNPVRTAAPSSLPFRQGRCLGGDGHGRRRRAPAGPLVADRGAPRVDPGLPARPPAAHPPPGHHHHRAQLAGGPLHRRSRAGRRAVRPVGAEQPRPGQRQLRLADAVLPHPAGVDRQRDPGQPRQGQRRGRPSSAAPRPRTPSWRG